MRTVGVHLVQPLGHGDSPRRSCVAELDRDARLVGLAHPDGDDAVLAAVGSAPALVAVDAPLAVPDGGGRRDVETVLSWLDVPVFPSSRGRLTRLHGGIRGEALAAALTAAGHTPREAVPDLVLRQLMWEASRPGHPEPVPLGDYREAWLGLRAPRYRAKGVGRATPAGRAPAREILATAVHLGDWRPHPAPDDWDAIRDAAVIDAVACALAAWRCVHAPGSSVTIGTPERGIVVSPADANLRERLTVNLDRLRGEGTIRI